MFGLKQNILDMILTEIKKHTEITDAILFGSRAKGNYKKGSDIDLAIKGEAITHDLVAKLTTEFNQKMPIPHHIDIIHYDTISNVSLLDHINRRGVSLMHLPDI